MSYNPLTRYPAMSTGLLSGAVMTPNTTTTFNLSAGTGVIVDYTTYATPNFQFINIPSQVVTLTGAALTRVVSWWYVDSTGVVQNMATQPTPTQRRTLIQLGVTAYVGGALQNVVAQPAYGPQATNQAYDLSYSLGSFTTTGATVSPNGANLQFNLAAGTIFSTAFNYDVSAPAMNNHPILAAAPSPFFYATQLANSETPATTLDPTHYDVAGTITAVGGGTGSSTIQRIYIFGTGNTATQVAVQYGQVVYGSLSAAVAAVGSGSVVTNPDFATGGILTAWVCMTRICTSLQDTGNCTILGAAKFAVP